MRKETVDWFGASLQSHADDPPIVLNAESILAAYAQRYGEEAAQAEREYLASGWLNSARLTVLAQVLNSACYLD